MSAEGRSTVLLPLALALLAASLYALNVGDFFVGDDFDLIRSFYGEPPSYFLKLLVYNESGDIWKSWGIDPEQGHGFLRPLKIWLLRLDLQLWGAWSVGFHLTSTLFFVATVLMAHRLLVPALPGRPMAAFAGGLVCAIHPVYSEVVPFITAREETIAACFGLAALGAFIRARSTERRPVAFFVFYALALLTKESAIVVAALAGAHDLAHGRLVGPRAWPVSRLARFYGPLALMVAAYFGMRWAAFGNFKGGDAYPTGYGSLDALWTFHLRFYRSLFDPTMNLFGGMLDRRVLMGAGLVALAALLIPLVAGWRRIEPARRRDLLFFGPLWYAGTTAILFGTHFALRRNGLVVIGLVIFATLALDTLAGLRAPNLRRVVPAIWAATCLVVLLPATLANSLEIHRASLLVRSIHRSIVERTAGLPDGSFVLLGNVPQWKVFPYYFGWALQSSLKRPFTETDLAERLVIIEPRNVELNGYRFPQPEKFDLTLEFPTDGWITREDTRRRVQRFVRNGLIRPDQVID